MSISLTKGSILKSLFGFAIPILLALLLQALYGAADLIVVGQFAKDIDVSAVATGSQLLQTVTTAVTGLAMGITISVGRLIGQNQKEKAGQYIGAACTLFLVISFFLVLFLTINSGSLAKLLHSPASAINATQTYIFICGCGAIFIVAYNLLGAIFRGIGDSTTPFITVLIACIINIIADIFFVAALNLGSSGAALATVLSQAISVIISLLIIKKKVLPFYFTKSFLRIDKHIWKLLLKLGAPVATQDLLVSLSFLFIQATANNLGIIASGGVGIAEKVCVFIMLIPSSYMQSMSAFVAQNIGAKQISRAKLALRYGIFSSLIVGFIMAMLTFSHGDAMSSIFSKNIEFIKASHDYLKSYAIDCMIISVVFCFVGYFNGLGKTFFVMLQGIIGAFFIRIPVVYFMSLFPQKSLFYIGLGTPISSTIQLTLCLLFFLQINHNENKKIKV